MKAKLILDNGKEIEIELTEEQEKAIKEDYFPENGEIYYAMSSDGYIYKNYFVTDTDYKLAAIGNCFKTEQEAEDMIRALKLIENVRRDRKKLNGNWAPDWNNYDQKKWDISHTRFNHFETYPSNTIQAASILGWYKSDEIAYQIINKYKSELIWFFNEFLPERYYYERWIWCNHEKEGGKNYVERHVLT